LTSVAVIHDYLTQRGGAERLVLSMLKAFPGAPLYTSLYRPDATFPDFRWADVRPLALDRFAFLRRHHRLALPLLAPAFSSLTLTADVVLCSSSGWAHGARVLGRKLVYCYTPARWLYQTQAYLGGHRPLAAAAVHLLDRQLRKWDQNAAHSADRYLTQSTAVRDRIRALYGIDAEVIPGPYRLGPGHRQVAVEGLAAGFYLCVSRLLPYKKVDAIIGAFAELPRAQLVVAGTGPKAAALKRLATGNVRLVGAVSDEQLAWLYANCAGVIAAAYEDYGLTPLEAAAFGKPAAVLRWGGFLDTVVEGETGVFFDSPTPAEVGAGVARLQAGDFVTSRIQNHAEAYSEERFIGRLRAAVLVEESGAIMSPGRTA
jgi:glycosyltransferase involved in cell wall biosynthesis